MKTVIYITGAFMTAFLGVFTKSQPDPYYAASFVLMVIAVAEAAPTTKDKSP